MNLMIKIINRQFDSDLISGIRDSSPICIAFLFMCISFGGLARTSELSVWQTMGMAMLVYSIPLQVILIQTLHSGLSIISIMLLTIIINSRFFLMSISLMPFFKGKSFKKIIPSFIMLSASSFTVSHVKFTTQKIADPFRYYIGVAISGYITTFISTIIGFYILSINNNEILKHIFGIALGIHFTALTAMRWPKYRAILATLIGFSMMPILLKYFTMNLSIIITPIITGVIMFIAYKEQNT
jgi:predicted branched-subunit amino acid permease